MKQVLLVAVLCFAVAGPAFSHFDLPQNLPPEEYGTVLIDRTSTQNKVEPAVFSHSVHRRKHTCRVCHFEIEFNFKVNTTEITEAVSKGAKFCGTAGCHDGKAVFGHEEVLTACVHVRGAVPHTRRQALCAPRLVDRCVVLRRRCLQERYVVATEHTLKPQCAAPPRRHGELLEGVLQRSRLADRLSSGDGHSGEKRAPLLSEAAHSGSVVVRDGDGAGDAHLVMLF